MKLLLRWVYLIASVVTSTWGIASLHADTLVLNNGGVIEGEVVTTSPTEVRFRTPDGEAIFARSDIAEIYRGESLAALFQQKLKALVYTDADAYVALAGWCRQQGLLAEMVDLLDHAITIAPNHAAARSALGHIQHEGRWLTSAAELETAGFVRYLGRWYPPAAATGLSINTEKQREHEELQVTINKLIKQVTNKQGDARRTARDELLAIARQRDMPQLAEVAAELYSRWNEHYRRVADSTDGSYSTLDLRLQHATVTLDQVQSTLATANPGEAAAITIDVPKVRLIDLKTTVVVPSARR